MDKKYKQILDLLEDFVLVSDHADFCHSKSGEVCNCMDTQYYNYENLTTKARDLLKKES